MSSVFLAESILVMFYIVSFMLGALKCMNGNTVQGPHCFSIVVFQVCWSVVRIDFMNFLHFFHERIAFKKSIKTTFIALYQEGRR